MKKIFALFILLAIVTGSFSVGAKEVFELQTESDGLVIIGEDIIYKNMTEVVKIPYQLTDSSGKAADAVWKLENPREGISISNDGRVRVAPNAPNENYTLSASCAGLVYKKTISVRNGYFYDFDRNGFGREDATVTDAQGNKFLDPNGIRVDSGKNLMLSAGQVTMEFDAKPLRTASLNMNKATFGTNPSVWWLEFGCVTAGEKANFFLHSFKTGIAKTEAVYSSQEYVHVKLDMDLKNRTISAYIAGEPLCENAEMDQNVTGYQFNTVLNFLPLDNLNIYTGKTVAQELELTFPEYMLLPKEGEESELLLTGRVLEDGREETDVPIIWSLAQDYPGLSIEGNVVTATDKAAGSFEVCGTIDGTEITVTKTVQLSLPDIYVECKGNQLIFSGTAGTPIEITVYGPKDETSIVKAFLESFDHETAGDDSSVVIHAKLDDIGKYQYDLSVLTPGLYQIYVKKESGGIESGIKVVHAFEKIFEGDVTAVLNDTGFTALLKLYSNLQTEQIEEAYQQYQKLIQKEAAAILLEKELNQFPFAVNLALMLEKKEYDEKFMKSLASEVEKMGLESRGLMTAAKNLSYGAVMTAVRQKGFDSCSTLVKRLLEQSILIGVAKLPNIRDGKIFLDALDNAKYNRADEAGKMKILNQVGNKTYADLQELNQAIDAVKMNSDSIGGGGAGGGATGGGNRGGSTGGFSGGSIAKPETLEKPQSTEKPSEMNYHDVSCQHWGYESIMELTRRGIVSGFNQNFRPEDAITRGEWTKLLSVTFVLPKGKADFLDVMDSDWYAPYIGAAQTAGLAEGDGGRFYPENLISREDAAVLLYRFAIYEGMIFESSANSFADREMISDYAQEAVGTLFASGIVRGRGNNWFAPKETVTRAEAAQLLYNFLSRREHG